MIIFGTRGVTRTLQGGGFFCPMCGTSKHYRLRQVRKFFTLYFIPVIPLNTLGEYVECDGCKNTYNTRVLAYQPKQGATDFEAEYFSAIKKVMIHMLLADGIIEDSEVDAVRGIYENLTGQAIDEDALRFEIHSIEGANEDLSRVLLTLQGSLNDAGKALVIKAALAVALADGEFPDEERALILQIGKDLGMSSAQLRAILSSEESENSPH